MTSSVIPGVIRVSRGNFDPARFAEVEVMSRKTQVYLVPAIRQLPGLSAYFVGASPAGSFTHVSLWETEAHADQMGKLKLMTENARSDAEAAGVSFLPIVDYPIAWRV